MYFNLKPRDKIRFAHKGCSVSILGDIQKLTGHSPKQPDLADLALAGGVD